MSLTPVGDDVAPSPMTFAGTFVGLAPDDSAIVTRCGDGTLRTWELGTGRERTRVVAPPGTHHAVAWLDAGPLVAGLDQATGDLWG